MQQLSAETEQQVTELVSWAAAEKQTLVISGYGSKAGFGHPVQADCQLSTRALSGIVSYESEELVMTALPGTPLATIQHTLAEHSQYLPFEPPTLHHLYHSGPETSIGGTFIGNLSGPARFRNGAARDYLLGINAVNGRGEKYKSGGKVIKNVSGYDMSKLLAGSWGTLSVVTELSFKVLPAPATAITIVIKDQDSAAAQALFQQIQGAPYEATGLAYIPQQLAQSIGQDTASVLLRLQGTQLSTEARVKDISADLLRGYDYEILQTEATEQLWQTIREVLPFQDEARTPAVLKLSIPPAAMLDISDVIEQPGGCLWFADAGGAWLWVGIDSVGLEDKISTIQQQVHNHQGTTILYRAAAEIKQHSTIFAIPDPRLQKMNQRIKQGFDPLDLFNPGRLGPTDAN
ncbi:MAG: FAD-binding protein [Gammaproteobacteria bacterium]